MKRSAINRGTSTLKNKTPLRAKPKQRAENNPSKLPPVRKQSSVPTAAQQRHMSIVASYGCVLCIRLGLGATPAELHHPRRGTGMGQRSSHFDVIPLCPNHHRGNEGIHGLGTKRFAVVYGIDEAGLLAELRAALGIENNETIDGEGRHE